MTYIYPDNLRAKATLWMWTLKDLILIGIGAILSVLSVSQAHFIAPAIVTAVYAVISIRMEDFSILDFIRNALRYFFGQQRYMWQKRSSS